MTMDDDMREMVLGGASNLQLRSAAIGKGMKTLRQAGLRKMTDGVTSMEEILGVTQ
jgi:type IV pilus assembly protein PilB